jgi:two-component system response regulator VicR
MPPTGAYEGLPSEDAVQTRGRVVVVNDEPAVLDLYRDILEELNFEPVGMVTTAIETDRIRGFEPDAVILDLQVGDQTGYGLTMARQLREVQRFARIPIIICTANAEALHRHRRMLRDIRVPVLLKPFTVGQIDQALRATSAAQSPDRPD